MVKTSDIRRELMARYVAQGVNFKIAARKAGFFSEATAYKVVNEPAFKERVDEILEAGLTDTIASVEVILQRLSDMLDADIRELFEVDDMIDTNGNIREIWSVTKPETWRNSVADRVEGIEFDRRGNPKVKFASTLSIIDKIGSAHGIWKQGIELTGKDGKPVETVTADMPEDVAAELYQAMLGR